MTSHSKDSIEAALNKIEDPWLKDSLLKVARLDELEITDDSIGLTLTLQYPCANGQEQLRQLVQEALHELAPGTELFITINTDIAAAPRRSDEPGLAEVKNIIAVASGKGGVGKSTTAVNLALALAAEGARVGILDADIYGPSLGKMLGVEDGERPEVEEVNGQQFFTPINALGLKANSMAFLVTEQTPVVWRGPMASGALLQLLNQTQWGELDYLVVDMPPGTGDIQLTLSQKVPVTGSVIVTTPQDLALLDARKGIEMFKKVDVPVLGVVENMAVHVCSNCGHVEHLFGEGGGKRMTDEYDTNLLGTLPLSLSIRQHADAGLPTVAAYRGESVAESAEAQLYLAMARRTGAQLAALNRVSAPAPTITFNDD